VSLGDAWRTFVAPGLLWCGPALEVAIVVGLTVRLRLRLCLTLPVFLIATLTTTTLAGVCPPCVTWEFWIAKELLHAVLMLVMGLELSARLFRGLPYSQAKARRRIIGVLALTALLLVTAPIGPASVVLLPRLLMGLAWLYFGLWLVVRSSRLVVDPLHASVLNGFTPWLLAYALTWARATDDTVLPNVLMPVLSVFVLVVLLKAAWRRDGTAVAAFA
jgi:hypothetical protein